MTDDTKALSYIPQIRQAYKELIATNESKLRLAINLQRIKIINMYLREFLTDNEPIGRDLWQIIEQYKQGLRADELKQLIETKDSCYQLAKRVSRLFTDLDDLVLHLQGCMEERRRA
jgi:hypothetical protein